MRHTPPGLLFPLDEPVRAKPFVKWAGGKQALLDALRPHFPTGCGRYFEPFLGGGSVLFGLAPDHAIVGDRNDWLLDTYEALREDWRAVAAVLDGLPNTKEDYLRIRAVPPESLAPATRAAHFIYLNKTGFRGLFRVNRAGRFNVPYGAYDRRYYDPENLEAVARRLGTVTIRRGDFEDVLGDAVRGDFVYLDPPYAQLGGHSDFNRYTDGPFGPADQERLAARCRRLADLGVGFVLSNHDLPWVRELYEGFEHAVVEARREINLSPSKRSIRELLVLNPAAPER
ncbi:MAG: DNA adenine methylase [Planctomycetota bacterium]|nr:DNA adenine methylase [Planctomycetota bacterium]